MKPKKHQFPTPSEEELSSYLRGAHGGLEGGETLVEGSKNGDHPLRDGLALVQRLPQEARPPLQGFRPLWNLHFPGSIPRRGGTNLRRKPLPASGAASLLTDRRLPAPAADHISGRILTGSLSTSAPPSPPPLRYPRSRRQASWKEDDARAASTRSATPSRGQL